MSASEQSTGDPTTVLYLDDDELLLDLQADIADGRETIELVPTTDTGQARNLLADREFDQMIVGAGHTRLAADELARDLDAAYPDLTLVLYAWEPRNGVEDTEVFDAVFKRQSGARETIRLLDRVTGLED